MSTEATEATEAIDAEVRCTILGGPFAIAVQVCLAVAAIATLIYKRHTERPRRPWLVWFFDATKQAFAGFLQHLVNLGFGMAFATGSIASECAWYLLNFAIAVVCGVVLLYAAMELYKKVIEHFQLHFLRSGEYGHPPSWKAWLAQLLIWGFLASGEKVLTAILVIVPLHPHLDVVASALEWPIKAYPKTELVIVMAVAPVVLNMGFFWVIDNLIMRKRSTSPSLALH